MRINVEGMSLVNIDYRKLKPLQGNLKLLTEDNYKKLKKSFTEKGLFVPMFVWQRGKEFLLLDGHGRERLFEKEKPTFVVNGKETTEVPCVVVHAKDLKDAKEKLLLITSQFQTMTQEGLDEFSFDLDDLWKKDTLNFDALNFNMDARPDLKDGLTDPDEAPEPPKVPKSRLGNLYELGPHRLLCGDSTVEASVQRLLGAVKPNLMVTDPPYGVNYDPNWRNEADRKNGKPYGARAVGKVQNDERADWGGAWALFPGNIAYVWHGALHAALVAESLIKQEFNIRAQIIWAKSRFVISRGDYHWQHEPCWYAVRKSGKGQWEGDRSQSTLWPITHSKSETGHGTQKPVECMRKPIENNSSEGQAVYDPFGGSGTTMIAAEQTGRACFMMELDPVYIDVIIERWQNFTGQKARKVGK